uniref:Uncharacterized protein n=1 Tax=Anguilla anguilla TaxID=7936 RepID=A0A0E9S8H5_ANGAN
MKTSSFSAVFLAIVLPRGTPLSRRSCTRVISRSTFCGV